MDDNHSQKRVKIIYICTKCKGTYASLGRRQHQAQAQPRIGGFRP